MAYLQTAQYSARLIGIDNNGKTVSRSVGAILPAQGEALANDSTANAAATRFDTFFRALNALTSNTYNDTDVSGKASINEILAL